MPLAIRSATVAAASPHLHGRIDRLIQELSGLSRAQVRGLFDHGCITLNGHLAAQPEERLKEGDRIELKYDPKLRYHERNKPRRNLGFEVVLRRQAPDRRSRRSC
jgi:23S rRNA pseudouridine1911/1915/1917 synthase